MSMVFHHFRDADAAIRECRRVLRRDRFACLRAGTIEQIDNYAFVPFFPETRTCSKQPESAGRLSSRRSRQPVSSHIGMNLFKAKPRKTGRITRSDSLCRADSILAQLTIPSFRGARSSSGICRDCPVEPVVEPVDFFVFRAMVPRRLATAISPSAFLESATERRTTKHGPLGIWRVLQVQQLWSTCRRTSESNARFSHSLRVNH